MHHWGLEEWTDKSVEEAIMNKNTTTGRNADKNYMKKMNTQDGKQRVARKPDVRNFQYIKREEWQYVEKNDSKGELTANLYSDPDEGPIMYTARNILPGPELLELFNKVAVANAKITKSVRVSFL